MSSTTSRNLLVCSDGERTAEDEDDAVQSTSKFCRFESSSDFICVRNNVRFSDLSKSRLKGCESAMESLLICISEWIAV